MKRAFVWLLTMMPGLISPAFSKDAKLLIGGSGNPYIYIIDKSTGEVEWKYELGRGEECNSVAMTEDGNILLSYRKGARLIDKDKEIIWDFPAAEGTEIQMAGIIPGGFVIGRCGFPATIFELNHDGTVRDSITVDMKQWGEMTLHGQFRQFIRTDQGHYIIPVHRNSRLIEVGHDGSVMKDFGLDKARPFSVIVMSSGNYLVPCGDSHYIVEMDRDTGEVVHKIDKIDGVMLQFMAQIVRLDNGNLLICNWGGHSGSASGTEPQLIEVDGDWNVVWKLDQFDKTGNVSAVYVIED